MICPGCGSDNVVCRECDDRLYLPEQPHHILHRDCRQIQERFDPPSRRDFCYAVIRKRGPGFFYDVNTIGLTRESAKRKADMVDEMKPEWAKKHPVVGIAKGRFVEQKPEGLKYE